MSHTYSQKIHGEDEAGALDYHRVQIKLAGHPDYNEGKTEIVFADISFQNGPLGETSPNGVFMEDVIAVCVERLEDYQETEFKCRDNTLAITKLQEALHCLGHRTTKRVERGVEGTSMP